MRVGLFIDTQNYGGAESVLLSLASFLVEIGHEPVIYQYENEPLQRAARELGIDCHTVPCWSAYKRTYRLPWFAYHFGRVLKDDRIDVLHSHLFGPIVAGGLTGWLTRVAHLGTLHDVYIVQERPIRARLLQLVHGLGTRLICVSEPMAEYYATVTGIDASELRVIRNGVDLRRYSPDSRSRSDCSSVVRLIMVGRLDAIKRHDLVFESLASIKDDPRWQLTIVGDGPQREVLEALVRDIDIESRVEFIGQRDDVAEFLGAADIFLLVSDSEGMSLSLLEALASGLPVIATRVGNNAELVKHGHSGLLIEPGDASQLAASVTTLVEDAALRRAFGKQALDVARGLDLRLTMASYQEVYEALVI